MGQGEKEYLVGTVRPTDRPEAGQEIDLDTQIPAKIRFVTRTMNFTRGTEEEFGASMPGLRTVLVPVCRFAVDSGWKTRQELVVSPKPVNGSKQRATPSAGRREGCARKYLRSMQSIKRAVLNSAGCSLSCMTR